MKSAATLPRWLTVTSAICCVLGILISIYAYHVETAHEKDATFRALCDISKGISCTKVFSSRWGRGFGLMPKDSILNQPNSVYGMAYYLIQSLLIFSVTTVGALIQLVFSVVCVSGCVYLAYILFFVLHDFCVVCVSMYVINAVILVCCVLKYRAVSSKETASSKQETKKSR